MPDSPGTWPQVTRLPYGPRVYRCSRCGHEETHETNHNGSTYSLGHYATCPTCPPWAKYPEFGGSTTWHYVREVEPEGSKGGS